ncbi:MAG: phosphoribosylanthranilate isomerase [bacterium]
MVKIKICGITNLEDALECTKLGVEALGFIFAESKRKISQEVAKEIISQLPPFVTTVGVFVNEEQRRVEEVARYCHLDVLQFHGDESFQYCQRFINYKIIKSFLVKERDSLKEIRRFLVSAYLFDTFEEGIYGGTGRSFNWQILKGNSFERPIIISGGLNSQNVTSCLELLNPYAIDVGSGVEKYPGKKDKEKLKEFIKKVRDLNKV